MCPGALRGGACHPLQPGPEKLMGTPGGDSRPCLHSVNQVDVVLFKKPCSSCKDSIAAGNCSLGGTGFRGQAAPQPEASCSLQKQSALVAPSPGKPG